MNATDPRHLLEMLVAMTGAQRGFLTVGDVTYSAPDPDTAPSRTLLHRAAKSPHPLLLADAQEDGAFSAAASIRGQHVRSLFAIPLRSGSETVGVLCLDHTERPNLFAPGDLSMLSGIASLAAAALTRMRPAGTPESGRLIGRSRVLRAVLDRIDRIADLPYPVHVHGESGSGKELLARALHRREGPFIAVNCAAIPATLAESACFGHVRGAFSGADRDQAGLFEMADGGTLFLDEVEAMAPALQEKLLRVLQDGEVRRVGSRETRDVSVRVISASNEDLPGLVRAGRFRSDLLYRLDVLRIEVPPLRQRPGDIQLLAEHFLDGFARETGRARPRITDAAADFLAQYDWPGNIRQLQNAIRQAASLASSDVLEPADFSFLKSAPVTWTGPYISIDEYLRRVVRACESSMPFSEIARMLGISRKKLWDRRRQWNDPGTSNIEAG